MSIMTRIAHPRAPPHPLRQIPGSAHALGAPGHGDIRVAQGDRLRRGDDRLQAGTAQPVQRQRRGILRDPRIHRRHARQIHVLRLGVHHIAEHHVLHFTAIHAGAGQRLARHLRAEFRRRDILQAAAEIADRGADAGNDINFTLHDADPPDWFRRQ